MSEIKKVMGEMLLLLVGRVGEQRWSVSESSLGGDRGGGGQGDI
jgi:hypothetical protein